MCAHDVGSYAHIHGYAFSDVVVLARRVRAGLAIFAAYVESNAARIASYSRWLFATHDVLRMCDATLARKRERICLSFSVNDLLSLCASLMIDLSTIGNVAFLRLVIFIIPFLRRVIATITICAQEVNKSISDFYFFFPILRHPCGWTSVSGWASHVWTISSGMSAALWLDQPWFG